MNRSSVLLKRITREFLRNNANHLQLNTIRRYTDAVSFTHRTNTCGCLRENDVGKNVKLCGWVNNKRMSGYFMLLRDWQGITQLVMEKPELVECVNSLNYESVVEITGTVRHREPGQENKDMPTGDIEVVVDSMNILNPAKKQKPFEVNKPIEVNEAQRMEYRYLDIRTNRMQRNLRLRSKMIMKIREYLANQHEFVDVETPALFRRTPGGAKEFVVPSHIPGKFYSLPQSPQQFKQLLMAGGIDRYYQIAKCFRDEGAKPDRQPEFTQLDLEMSFVDREGILGLIEEMLVHSWPSDLEPIQTPFPRMTYQSAMQDYGSDKPDTRFEMKLQDVTNVCIESDLLTHHGQKAEVAIALRIPEGANHISNKEMKSLIEEVIYLTKETKLKTIVGKVKQREDLSLKIFDKELTASLTPVLELQKDDCVFITSGPKDLVQNFMGRLRLLAADHLENKGVHVRDKSNYNFLWVLDFPLFLRKETGDGLESAHHPFTDVHPDDRHLLYSHPDQVRGQHYDLVLNGSEVGGGSIRIHKADDQQYILNKVLKEDSSELSHLLEAFTLGCPPHGGIALGLDRLFAVLTDSVSIRDVIAFPKSSDGRDLMSKAPTSLSEQQLEYYHIKVDVKTKNTKSDTVNTSGELSAKDVIKS